MGSLVLSLVAHALAQTSEQNAGAASAQSAVEQVLHVQQDAWNRHDLDAFMAGYWNSAGSHVLLGRQADRGWQATIDRYKATYQSPGHEMGKLEFSDLRIEMLGADAASFAGRGT